MKVAQVTVRELYKTVTFGGKHLPPTKVIVYDNCTALPIPIQIRESRSGDVVKVSFNFANVRIVVYMMDLYPEAGEWHVQRIEACYGSFPNNIVLQVWEKERLEDFSKLWGGFPGTVRPSGSD